MKKTEIDNLLDKTVGKGKNADFFDLDVMAAFSDLAGIGHKGNPGGKGPMNNKGSQRRTPWVNGPSKKIREILDTAMKEIR